MIQELLARAAEDLTVALNNFESARKELTDDELAAFKEVCRKAKEAVQEALEAAKGALDTKTAETIRQIETLLAQSTQAIERKITEAKQDIDTTAQTATADITGKVDKAKQDVDTKVQQGLTSIDEKTAQAGTDITGKVDKAKQNVDAKIQQGLTSIDEKTAQAGTDITGKVDKAKQNVDAKIQQGLTSLDEKVAQGVAAVGTKEQQASDTLNNKVTHVQQLITTVTDAQQALQAKIDDIQNQLPVMPLNPVACYDFADVQYKTIFTHGRIESTGSYGFGPTINLTPYKGKTIKVTASGYRKGKVGYPRLYVYEKGWTWSAHTGNELNSETEKTAMIIVTLPTKYEKIEALWHHRAYEEAHNTVIVTGFKIETLQNTVIDASENDNHSTINGAIAKHKDDSIGTALLFEQGFLSRKSQDFIGVGKQWSHSRWIKINPSEQDKTKNFRLWAYNTYDYLILDCKANSGKFNNFTFMTYKDDTNLLVFSIPAEKVLNNEWHHLVVMTDLQKTYCRKIVYLDNFKIAEYTTHKDFSDFSPQEWAAHGVHYDMLQNSSDIAVKGSLANLIFFDRLLTEREVLWLGLNPQYPIKHYTKADKTLLELFKNGYIQWNGMELPDTVFNQAGYRWKKLHTYETHAVWKLEAV